MTIERERPANETTVLDLSGADEFDDEYFLDEDGDEEDGLAPAGVAAPGLPERWLCARGGDLLQEPG